MLYNFFLLLQKDIKRIIKNNVYIFTEFVFFEKDFNLRNK